MYAMVNHFKTLLVISSSKSLFSNPLQDHFYAIFLPLIISSHRFKLFLFTCDSLLAAREIPPPVLTDNLLTSLNLERVAISFSIFKSSYQQFYIWFLEQVYQNILTKMGLSAKKKKKKKKILMLVSKGVEFPPTEPSEEVLLRDIP